MEKKLDQMTEEQVKAMFESVLKDYFAESKHRKQLSEDEIIEIAKKLNKRINVPLVRETGEEKILVKVVMKLDNFLYNHLPNEFYDLVRSTDKGIDDDEAKRLISRLTKLANSKIDIPYLPEIAEHYAIKLIISLIINSARKEKALSIVINSLDTNESGHNGDFILNYEG